MDAEVRRVRREVARALAAAGVGVEDTLAVACSGGPDSLVLADALLALRPGLVSLVYVNHGLRPEADAEGEAVAAFAAHAGARWRVVRARIARRPGDGGLENAARKARYAALDVAAGELGARWIALGHTASDQAETVLARLLRGAGPAGLAGMAAARGRYLRPLLGVSRHEVLRYAGARDLHPSRDAMNDDPSFLRVRVRNQHLPRLRAENPRLDDALVRTASAMRETLEALDWMAARVAASIDGKAARFAAVELAAVPRAVARRALAQRADALGASLEARHLDAVLALASSRHPSAAVDLPGLVARREYGDLVLERRPSASTAAPRLAVAGDQPYEVRPWRPGDRMRPARLRGRSRKLQDLFTDAKVPAAARRRARVVVRASDGEIVWAEHIGPAHASDVEVSLTLPDPPATFE